MNSTKKSISLVLAQAAVLACSQAGAQVLGDTEYRREGADAVLAIRFLTEIQFQRSIVARSGDIALVNYQLVSTNNARLGPTTQGLAVRALPGLPSIQIADETDRGEQARRLVLRFSEAMPVAVRAGKGNRSIELVFAGKAGALLGDEQARARPTTNAARAPVNAATTPAAAVALPSSSAPAVAAVAAAPASPGLGQTPLPSPPTVPAVLMQGTPANEAKASTLMAAARAAVAASRYADAVEPLNQLLELPPTSHTRDAQEMVAVAWARLGEVARARAEFDTYLQLFPSGEGADRVRRELAALPVPAAAAVNIAGAAPGQLGPTGKPVQATEITTGGSSSMTYFGGNGQVRSRDFQESPISGLPTQAGDAQFSSDKSRQIYNDVDVNWRRRNADVDQRFVLRDSYTTDLERPSRNKNRLSALYFDHKSISDGWSARLGRQSPTGGGVMSRFDGVQGFWTAMPRVKFGAVVGEPTEKYFDSKRHFYGLSVDLDRITPSFGAGAFLVEQRIDGQIDRRAMGVDMRYFKGGASVFSQFDYDLLIKGINIATVQGTFITDDNTVINGLFDRRALTTLTLGNALTFADPNNPGQLFTHIQDKLAQVPIGALREQIKRITPNITQAQIGVTKPITKSWQVGASVQMSNTGAIPPVPEVAGFELGRPATGNVITTSAQLIGLNLYSARDTHVFSTSVISSPTLKGNLLGYNNSSFVMSDWQLEPSLQFYKDHNTSGARSQRWTPGLRLTYRGWQKWAFESSLTYEIGRSSRLTADPALPGAMITTEEKSNRVNYSLGARYEF